MYREGTYKTNHSRACWWHRCCPKVRWRMTKELFPPGGEPAKADYKGSVTVQDISSSYCEDTNTTKGDTKFSLTTCNSLQHVTVLPTRTYYTANVTSYGRGQLDKNSTLRGGTRRTNYCTKLMSKYNFFAEEEVAHVLASSQATACWRRLLDARERPWRLLKILRLLIGWFPH